MKNITLPRVVSFETALQNLAARLTGTFAADLPKSQEAIVQYLAENIPTVDELAESITREVLARLTEKPVGAPADPATGAESDTVGSDEQEATADAKAAAAKRSKTKVTE